MNNSNLLGINEIYIYIKNQYDSYSDILKRIDTKIGQILAVLGVMAAFISALVPQLVYIKENTHCLCNIYIPLILFVYSIFEIIMIGKYSLDLFVVKYSIPGVSKSLIEIQQLNNIDQEILIRELTINYMSALDELKKLENWRTPILIKVGKCIRHGGVSLLLFLISIIVIRLVI